MNVFAALIDPPAIHVPAGVVKRKAARRVPKCPGDPRYTRKLYDLPQIANPWDLTPHQAEMLRLAVLGLSNHEIATKLGLKVKTVDIHFTNLYGRMEAVEPEPVNRVRAAVLWDRFTRQNTQPKE